MLSSKHGRRWRAALNLLPTGNGLVLFRAPKLALCRLVLVGGEDEVPTMVCFFPPGSLLAASGRVLFLLLDIFNTYFSCWTVFFLCLCWRGCCREVFPFVVLWDVSLILACHLAGMLASRHWHVCCGMCGIDEGAGWCDHYTIYYLDSHTLSCSFYSALLWDLGRFLHYSTMVLLVGIP